MSLRHPALPPSVSWPWMAAAGLVWLVTAVAGPGAEPAIPQGAYQGEILLLGHVVEGRFGPWALASTNRGTVLADFEEPPDAGRGDRLTVSGRLDGEPGTASGRVYGSRLDVDRVEAVTPSRFPPHVAGRAVARRVSERLAPFDSRRALLAGFLIGDTSQIDPVDVEAMRRSGLAHYVAVSGSNVALFLGLLALVAAPLSIGPRRRAILGLLALPVYVAATRFEPSVMRAAVMAGIALAGKLVGLVLEAWQLLSVSVVVLLLADPGLASSLGFQLSVAATGGVLVGGRWPVNGRMGRALAVTLGAQIAVAPLLLWRFGSIPLLSPLANMVAAPLVAGSTLLGALGVLGPAFILEPAAWLAHGVLLLARTAAAWPQVGWTAAVGIGLSVALVASRPRLRPLAALVAAAVLSVALLPSAGAPPASVVVLDVGQGDAILIQGDPGRWALVDGGPDGVVLLEKLRSYQVTALELVVLTHVHADHATGLESVVGRIPVGLVWESTAPHVTEASNAFFAAAAAAGVPVSTPAAGARWDLGAVDLVVEGPLRRYASPNDQSMVITVHGPARSMLLAGDIELHAQAELAHLRADVLKVPHQGAATSDPDWLRSVGAEHAVISVGPNDYGHPADWVVEVLAETAVVSRTDQLGDVIVPLGVP